MVPISKFFSHFSLSRRILLGEGLAIILILTSILLTSAITPVSGDNLVLENIRFNGDPIPHQLRVEIGGCNLQKLTPKGTYVDPATNRTKFVSQADFTAQINVWTAVLPQDYWGSTINPVTMRKTIFSGYTYDKWLCWDNEWDTSCMQNLAPRTYTAEWQYYNLSQGANDYDFRGDLTFDLRFISPWGSSQVPIEVMEDETLNDVLDLGPVEATGYGRGSLVKYEGKEVLEQDTDYYVSNSRVEVGAVDMQVHGPSSGAWGEATDAQLQWDAIAPSAQLATIGSWASYGDHDERPGRVIPVSAGAEVFAPHQGSSATAKLRMDMTPGAWTRYRTDKVTSWIGSYIKLYSQQTLTGARPAGIAYQGVITTSYPKTVCMFKTTNYLSRYTIGFTVQLETPAYANGIASQNILLDPNYYLEKAVWDISVNGEGGEFVWTGNTGDWLGMGAAGFQFAIWNFLVPVIIIAVIGFALYIAFQNRDAISGWFGRRINKKGRGK